MQLFPLSRFAYQLIHRIVQKIKNDSFPFNNKGFGGGGTPQVQAPPSPQPTPTPTNMNPVATASDRAAQLKKLQFGLSSTQTNAGGATGMVGKGPNLTPSVTPGSGTATTTGGT